MAEQKESPERELLLGFIFDSQGYLDHWPLGCKDNQININAIQSYASTPISVFCNEICRLYDSFECNIEKS